jgi:hypothetical protein
MASDSGTRGVSLKTSYPILTVNRRPRKIMAELSTDQEQKLIEALIALGWKKDPERESYAIIVRILNCSGDEAKATLEYLYIKRGLIRRVSSSGEDLDSWRPKPLVRWRWIAT